MFYRILFSSVQHNLLLQKKFPLSEPAHQTLPWDDAIKNRGWSNISCHTLFADILSTTTGWAFSTSCSKALGGLLHREVILSITERNCKWDVAGSAADGGCAGVVIIITFVSWNLSAVELHVESPRQVNNINRCHLFSSPRHQQPQWLDALERVNLYHHGQRPSSHVSGEDLMQMVAHYQKLYYGQVFHITCSEATVTILTLATTISLCSWLHQLLWEVASSGDVDFYLAILSGSKSSTYCHWSFSNQLQEGPRGRFIVYIVLYSETAKNRRHRVLSWWFTVDRQLYKRIYNLFCGDSTWQKVMSSVW